ncbi:hypothetical protein EVAR_80986_1 [Eumeta japonica]|uniref:Uncharacterized protein n=1 Tax=Eumeta variegata TaxID=151549 RepID=A0A4C1WSC5_EUMVA|nr:hypothetical protein EVAR_80986_1 [Eumeta japonica]
MALCNRGRMFQRQLDLRNSAVSSAKSASWTPVFGRRTSFTYAEYSRGETVESRDFSRSSKAIELSGFVRAGVGTAPSVLKALASPQQLLATRARQNYPKAVVDHCIDVVESDHLDGSNLDQLNRSGFVRSWVFHTLFSGAAGDQEDLSVGTPTLSSTVTAVSGSDGEVKCAPHTRGGAEREERTGKGRGVTTRVALMSALRIPGAMPAHDGRDAGSLQAGGALPETISP